MRLGIRIGFILLVCMLVFVGCEPEESVYKNEYILFENSLQISIPEYIYSDNNIVFQVGGDTTSKYNRTDTLSSKPVFQWNESSATFLLAAIFSAPIQVDEYNILNPDDIIWQWNTGMEFGSNGKVLYSEGKSVLNGTFSEAEVTPLVSGDYYFAIWGWTTEAKKIAYSSSQIHFYVKE